MRHQRTWTDRRRIRRRQRPFRVPGGVAGGGDYGDGQAESLGYLLQREGTGPLPADVDLAGVNRVQAQVFQLLPLISGKIAQGHGETIGN